MTNRFLTLVAASALAAVAALSAQTARPWTAARTPWGHPDLQGIWNAATLTPLERPDTAGGKLSLTKDEADRIERTERARVEARARPSDPNRAAPTVGGAVGGYNNFWIDRGT